MLLFLRFVYVSDSFVKYVPHKMHTVSLCFVINYLRPSDAYMRRWTNHDWFR